MKKLKCLRKRLMSYLPSPLPVTTEEFEIFATDVLDTYGVEQLDDHKASIGTLIMHTTQRELWKPKRFFYLGLRKLWANHASYQYIKSIQAKKEATKLQKDNDVAKEPPKTVV